MQKKLIALAEENKTQKAIIERIKSDYDLLEARFDDLNNRLEESLKESLKLCFRQIVLKLGKMNILIVFGIPIVEKGRNRSVKILIYFTGGLVIIPGKWLHITP